MNIRKDERWWNGLVATGAVMIVAGVLMIIFQFKPSKALFWCIFMGGFELECMALDGDYFDRFSKRSTAGKLLQLLISFIGVLLIYFIVFSDISTSSRIFLLVLVFAFLVGFALWKNLQGRRVKT